MKIPQNLPLPPAGEGRGGGPPGDQNPQKILIIRLGALGDMFLSFPAFADIRAHHPTAHITLLTTPTFAALAAESPWFNAIKTDTRPSWFNLPALWRLRQTLQADLIYDLQTSRRTNRYFILAGRPPWSGIAPGCTFPDADPRRNFKHTITRQRDQLAAAGVPPSTPPNLSWLSHQGPQIPSPYVLLVPGTSGSHGGAKTWPLARYASLATYLAAQNLRPVIIGTRAETAAAAAIIATCPQALDLTGQTTIQQLAGLAARATLTIGGDTGPVHAAAIMGCPTLALFSRYSNITQATPLGAKVLQADNVTHITLDQVIKALPKILPLPPSGEGRGPSRSDGKGEG